MRKERGNNMQEIYHKISETNKMIKLKQCLTCNDYFLENKENFHFQTKNNKIYFHSHCKKCDHSKMLEYQKRNSEENSIEALQLYLEKFGISLLNIVRKINRERGLI